MLKRTAILSLALICLSLGASRVSARTPMSPRVPVTYKVEGIRAEFLFNAMNKFERVDGLQGTSDCAMGTCGATMSYVTCAKNMDEGPSQIFPGEMNQPFMTCSAKSTDPKRAFINVSYRDNEGVRELRHSLNEITGKEFAADKSKSITAQSINCTAHAVNRDMDTIEIETTYECEIVR